ncbi:hypothetical protein D3C72_2493980 [compost metagenome]
MKFPTGKNDDDVDTASMIGRALDEAHPAVVTVKKTDPPRDRWARAFEDRGEESWKVA